MSRYGGKYAPKHRAQTKSRIGKKPVVAIVAVVLAAAAIFGGTFAWQSISQEALNEVSATVNPGGRLHDDFNDVTEEKNEDHLVYDKDVYVENFTTVLDNGVQIYARVRLDEYMEIGAGAGTADTGDGSKYETVTPLVPGTVMEDKSTWKPHVYGAENSDDPFHDYWSWTFASETEGTDGSTVYMPTFNKNKDSLEADINGTFDAQFEDYREWSEGNTSDAEWKAIYDADTAADGTKETDELVRDGWNTASVIDGSAENFAEEAYKQHIELKKETHTAKTTLTSYVIPMSQYIEWLNNDNPADDQGKFWVYDTDGWAYWAAPIDPDTATGLLLDGIERTDVIINQDWYYGINVVAQFITGDDLGAPTDENPEGSGFYDAAEGAPPSDNALLLLNRIGVDVTFEVETAEELEKALKYGGTIKLADEIGEISIGKQLEVCADTVLDLGDGNVLKPSNAIWDEESENKSWSILSVRNGATLTINGGNYTAIEDDSFCVDVRDGSKVIINGGTFKGNISAVYVHEGEAIINGGTYSIMQLDENGSNGYDEMLNCKDENYADGTAKISVFGGSFYDFDPANSNDGSYVPRGYKSTGNVEGNTTIYTVSRSSVSETESEVTEQ